MSQPAEPRVLVVDDEPNIVDVVTIRGYAELYRMAAARSPEEVEEAMRRIEDELTPARLDKIAEAPRTAVDLGALAGGRCGWWGRRVLRRAAGGGGGPRNCGWLVRVACIGSS